MSEWFREFARRARDAKHFRDNFCPRCRQRVNPLLHIWNPFLCSEFHFGGKPEPHKDDLG